MTTYMRRVSAVVLMCFVATACTEKLKEHLKEKVAQDQTSDNTGGIPCSLLDSAEVAAAIGPLTGQPMGCPYGSYFVTRAPTSFAIAASVVCAAFRPSRKSSSLYVL